MLESKADAMAIQPDPIASAQKPPSKIGTGSVRAWARSSAAAALHGVTWLGFPPLAD
jgi:hypothetical protein